MSESTPKPLDLRKLAQASNESERQVAAALQSIVAPTENSPGNPAVVTTLIQSDAFKQISWLFAAHLRNVTLPILEEVAIASEAKALAAAAEEGEQSVSTDPTPERVLFDATRSALSQ